MVISSICNKAIPSPAENEYFRGVIDEINRLSVFARLSGDMRENGREYSGLGVGRIRSFKVGGPTGTCVKKSGCQLND